MRFFENIRIGKRLGIGFAIFIVIIALLALLGFKIIDDVDRKAGHIVEAALEKTILANTVMGAIYNAYNSMGVIAFATDAAVIEAEKENLGGMRQTYGEALAKLAADTSFTLSCGHTFVIFMKDGFPINVLNAVKGCQEVCRIFCATANPLEVVVAETTGGRGIMGVIDGARPTGIEKDEDKRARKEMLRKFGYKL